MSEHVMQSGPAVVPGEKADIVVRRVLGYAVDVLVLGVLTTVVGLVVQLAPGTTEGFVLGTTPAPVITMMVAVLLLALGVFVVWPATHRGRTPGMTVTGLRVVRSDGGEAMAGQLLVRWVLLIVDGLFAGLVGLLTMLVSARHRRLGDMAAGTEVVRWAPPI